MGMTLLDARSSTFCCCSRMPNMPGMDDVLMFEVVSGRYLTESRLHGMCSALQHVTQHHITPKCN